MWRAWALGSCCALLLVMSACGPLNKPMVPRPHDKEQRAISAGWDRALSPVGNLNRQEWLDLLVGGGTWACGVDRLTLRSEKRFKGGLVVMEVHYNHAFPKDDRFELTVFDAAGKTVRQERYNRKEVEATYEGLYGPPPSSRATPARWEDRRKARWEKIAKVFPRAEEKNQGE